MCVCVYIQYVGVFAKKPLPVTSQLLIFVPYLWNHQVKGLFPTYETGV